MKWILRLTFSFDADFETVIFETVVLEPFFLGIQKTVNFVCVLAVSCNSDTGGRFCPVDNSLSKVCCDNDSLLRVFCVDDDVFGSDTDNISCSFSSLSTFSLTCRCHVSGLLLTVWNPFLANSRWRNSASFSSFNL